METATHASGPRATKVCVCVCVCLGFSSVFLSLRVVFTHFPCVRKIMNAIQTYRAYTQYSPIHPLFLLPCLSAKADLVLFLEALETRGQILRLWGASSYINFNYLAFPLRPWAFQKHFPYI